MSTGIYSLVDLFAGSGGLSLGFENAGFTPVFVSELNDDALSTYLLNRHHSLGGLQFRDNQSLILNDANELEGARLDQLKQDLMKLPEVDFSFDSGKATLGAGSNLDIVSGGPPCQGFSGIGHRRSYAVDKVYLPSNHLYGRMARVIAALRPRIFLFENVQGLLNSKWTREDGKLIWPDVQEEFNSIDGYTVRWSLVYAKDYGVPQNRPRVLLVGIRNDILALSSIPDPSADSVDAVACGFLPQPVPNSFPHLEDLLGDLIDPSIEPILLWGRYPEGRFATDEYPRAPKTAIQKHLRQKPHWNKRARVSLTDQEYSKHKSHVVEKFRAMQANGGQIPDEFRTKKFSQRLLRAQWGPHGPNITATSLPDDYVHFSQPRILTVREWARLQLFPDWYQFSGKRTTGGVRRAGNPVEGIHDREVPKYTQIGNAVPVGLAERVGTHLRSILDDAIGLRS